MFDPQRALWRRFMRSEHGRREGCATRVSRTRETSNGDVRVAQFAAMLRGVGEVTEQLKIGAALKKIIVESLNVVSASLPAIDARMTIPLTAIGLQTYRRHGRFQVALKFQLSD